MNAVKIDFLFFRPTDSIFSLSAELLSPIQFPSPPRHLEEGSKKMHPATFFDPFARFWKTYI